VEEQKMKLKIIKLCLGIMMVAALQGLVNADTPGRHPAYLHARSDLRRAQLLMRVREEPNVTRRLVEADHAVEAAIAEIDRAAVIDRKDIEDHPHVDAFPDRRRRFGRIVELLRSARRDLAKEEDNGRARGWRDAAFHHIDEALEHMHQAAVDQHWDHEFGY
jgi:hypothetical protein